MAMTMILQLYMFIYYMAFSPVDEHNSDRLPIFQRQSSFKKKHFLQGVTWLSNEDTLLPCNIKPSSKTTTSSELSSKSADDNSAFGIAEAMGYTKDLITKAIHKLHSQNIFRFNVTELLDVLFGIEAQNEDLGTSADDLKEEYNNDIKFNEIFQNSCRPQYAHRNLINHSNVTDKHDTKSSLSLTKAAKVTKEKNAEHTSKSNLLLTTSIKKEISIENEGEKLPSTKEAENDTIAAESCTSTIVRNLSSAASNTSQISEKQEQNPDERLLDKRLKQLKIKPGSKSLEYRSSNAELNLNEKRQPISLPVELPKQQRILTKEQMEKLQQLEAGRNTLRKDVFCNQCFSKKIGLLFLPCRHMRACESCGNKMNTCDKCGKNVAATVKIYI